MSKWSGKIPKGALKDSTAKKPPLLSKAEMTAAATAWRSGKLATAQPTHGRKQLKKANIPHDDEVEQAVLGSMLIESRAVQVARQFLRPEHFYNEAHRTVFTAILQIADGGAEVDVVMVSSKLRDTGKFETMITGPDIAAFVDRVVSAGHVEHYAKIVAGLYLEREIIRTCGELAMKQTAELLDRLRALHLEKESLNAPFMFTYEHGLAAVMESLEAPKVGNVFKTYYPTIDACWHAMKKGEINTWGAATNDGKSVMLLNLLDRAAMDKKRCLYVGTEMSAIETVSRHLSIQANVEAWRIRKPELEKPHLTKIHHAMADVMSKMQVSILDDPEPDLAKIEAAIYNCKPDIVFLDYLERFSMPRAENLRLQIKEFMRRLKTLARRNEVVIHLAAQLNRDVYGSEERPPTLADLSESSAIEKESDRVILLWSQRAPQKFRPKGPDAQPLPPAPVLKDHHRLIQAIGAKNRHGPKGLTFEFVLSEINLKVQEMKEYQDPFNRTINEGE